MYPIVGGVCWQPCMHASVSCARSNTGNTISLVKAERQGTVWHGMVEVCEGAPVAVSGWVLTNRHDLAPCAANSLHRETISVNNIIGGTGTFGIA